MSSLECWRLATSGTDPLESVRSSTARVMQSAKHVEIVKAEVDALADDWKRKYQAGGMQALITADMGWQGCNWHFYDDAESGGPLTCQYVFVLDSLNFCFWPTRGLEYEHLAVGLRNALRRNPRALSAQALCEATPETLRSWIPGFEIPQAEDRAAKLRELGSVIIAHFDGLAANLVASARGSASALVAAIVALLPGFRDEQLYEGRQVFLYKRAQIVVADCWAAYGRRAPPHKFGLSDPERLTAFADYRVPQLLVGVGALKYTAALNRTIGERRTLPAGSSEEVEIRAATVQAVEQLRKAAADRGIQLLSIEIDWLLWHLGEARKDDDLPPHHRTLTPFY